MSLYRASSPTPMPQKHPAAVSTAALWKKHQGPSLRVSEQPPGVFLACSPRTQVSSLFPASFHLKSITPHCLPRLFYLFWSEIPYISFPIIMRRIANMYWEFCKCHIVFVSTSCALLSLTFQPTYERSLAFVIKMWRGLCSIPRSQRQAQNQVPHLATLTTMLSVSSDS